jgi:hypothetical protein
VTYYPLPQPTIANNILLRRERRLRVPGEVLVRAGQRVEPSDVVAQSTITPDPMQVNIAAELGLSPAATSKRLRATVGHPVEQGAALAQRGGIGSRVARAPIAGVFSGFDPATGIGLITPPSEHVSVHAYLKGIVTDLIPYYGAIIETPAILIRGIFGVGGEQHGVLKVTVSSHDEALQEEVIDARLTYGLALAGGEVTAAVLQQAIKVGARGVIAGSMRSSELAKFIGHDSHAHNVNQANPHGTSPWRLGASSTNWDFPPTPPGAISPVPPDFVLIITEGFGSVPMSSRTFEMLAAYDGQQIALNGATRLRGGLARPEIIIPMARTTQVNWLGEGPQLTVGTAVRLLAPDYLGQVATITGLPVGPRAAQSGVVAPVADVTLPGDRRLRVPLVDLEALE